MVQRLTVTLNLLGGARLDFTSAHLLDSTLGQNIYLDLLLSTKHNWDLLLIMGDLPPKYEINQRIHTHIHPHQCFL